RARCRLVMECGTHSTSDAVGGSLDGEIDLGRDGVSYLCDRAAGGGEQHHCREGQASGDRGADTQLSRPHVKGLSAVLPAACTANEWFVAGSSGVALGSDESIGESEGESPLLAAAPALSSSLFLGQNAQVTNS